MSSRLYPICSSFHESHTFDVLFIEVYYNVWLRWPVNKDIKLFYFQPVKLPVNQTNAVLELCQRTQLTPNVTSAMNIITPIVIAIANVSNLVAVKKNIAQLSPSSELSLKLCDGIITEQIFQ